MVKNENQSLKYLISFADATYGHIGTIYRASNWLKDGILDPDYKYKSEDGTYYHKYTIWKRAKNSNMTEMQYAYENNLDKIYGFEKYRYLWIYDQK